MTLLPVIRSVVGSVLPGLFNQPITIHVFTAGTLSAPPTYVDHVLTDGGFLDSRRIDLRGAGLIEADETAILFYTNQLPSGVVLKSDDEATVTDKDSATARYKLLRLAEQDPAEATQTWASVATT